MWTLLAASDGWRSAAELNAVTVTASWPDGVDTRAFVMGGFVADVQGRALELAPPIPSGREWDARAGERLTLSFARRVLPAAPTTPAPIVAPVAEPDSIVDFVSRTTPGGPVVLQALLTVLVFALVLLKTPATPWGVMLAAGMLVGVPWIPAAVGIGSPAAAAIVGVNVLTGAFCWKTWVARTEA